MSRIDFVTHTFVCDESRCTMTLESNYNARPMTDDEQIDYAEEWGWAFEMIGGREFWRCPSHTGRSKEVRNVQS